MDSFASHNGDTWCGEVLSPGQGELSAAGLVGELTKSGLIRCS